MTDDELMEIVVERARIGFREQAEADIKPEPQRFQRGRGNPSYGITLHHTRRYKANPYLTVIDGGKK